MSISVVSGRHRGLIPPNRWSWTIFFSKRNHLLYTVTHTHTHNRLTPFCPGLPRWAGTRKVKPIWILLKQETVSGSGISWAICKSAPRSRQITAPAPEQFFTGWMPFLLPNQQCQQSSQNLLPSLSVRYARRLNPLKCAYFDHLQAAVILNCLYSQ